MAKQEKEGLSKTRGQGENPVADSMSMDEFLKSVGYTDTQELTFEQRPLEPGKIWLVDFQGIVDIGEKEIMGRVSQFNIYGAIGLPKDEYAGKKFTFIPGGLFDFVVKKKELKKGDKLALQFLGTVELEDSRKANQWKIIKL